MRKPVILALMPVRGNARVLSDMLERVGYTTLITTCVSETRAMPEAGHTVDVVLIDAGGCRRDLWSICEFVRSHGIPFLLICPRPDSSFQQEALARGAFAVLPKPLQPKLLHRLLAALTTSRAGA